MYMRERFHDVLPPMPDAVSFDVTAAAQWFLRDDEKESYDLTEYPSLLSPYPEIWMEYVQPKYTRDDGEIIPTPSKIKASGCYIRTNELPSSIADSIVGKEVEFLRHAISTYVGHAKMEMGSRFPPVVNESTARWLSVGVVCDATDDTCLLVYVYAMLLDGLGKYIYRIGLPFPVNLVQLVTGRNQMHARMILEAAGEDATRDAGDHLVNAESPYNFCLSLLHCRNVQVIDKPAPPAPILKQRAKKGIPYIQYKTLEVTPLRTVRQGGTRKDGTPEPKALHFVRGHFKDFSDKGLFGKYKGVYWWDSQVRGDTAKGIIDKDYRVSRD